MPTAHKPAGHSTVSPYLVVNGAERAIDFLKEVFGAEEVFRFNRDDGSIAHAEVKIDDTIVMLGNSSDGWRPVPCHVHVYVPDVDATFKRALEAGAEAVQEPVQKGDPDKRGGVKDPTGTTWWIATHVG